MKRILYFSVAREDVDDAKVDEIVDQAVRNNAQEGITGALGFNGRHFCQLLEGKPDVIDGLVEKIRNDPRHSAFHLIDERRIEARAFADWAMMRVDNLHIQHIIDAMKL